MLNEMQVLIKQPLVLSASSILQDSDSGFTDCNIDSQLINNTQITYLLPISNYMLPSFLPMLLK